MDKLTKEEVLHVAHLARINVNDDEIDKYARELKLLLDDVEKIKNIDTDTKELLVTPVSHESILREDTDTSSVEFNDIKKNVPAVTGNFVEVPVMVNE
jgi:aspartyl-tRNA(Asn)/glutamyl-tRNA(Gln) amidotransferase subunit C